MRENYVIERASIEDFQQVKSLLELVDLPVEGVDDHIEHFLVTRSRKENSTSDAIVGSVGLEIYDSNAVLRSLAVHPEHKGQKLGRDLIFGIINLAMKMGVDQLYLLTTTAERYFISHGFNIISRDSVPQAILDSPEFSHMCPTTATCMTKQVPTETS